MVTLHDALDYHDRGFAIIPVNHRTKAARCKWERYQTDRPSESQVRKWFGADNQMAMGGIMGPVSGDLVCRDFDSLAVYDDWAGKNQSLAKALPTVATPRPGRHVYMQADVAEIRAVRGGSILDYGAGNGELRGGGYCLLPPSNHGNETYRWLIPMGSDIPQVDLHDAGLLPAMQHRATQSNSEGLRDMSYAVLHGTIPSCDRVEMAIVVTLPTEGGRRHRCLFELARELKAIPQLRNADISDLRPIVVRWHRAALPMIRTKSFDESWLDFVEGWGRVKFPKGQEPIQIMFDTAKQAAEDCLPDIALQYDTAEVRLLICLCRELQRHHGDEPFFLDCRTAGKATLHRSHPCLPLAQAALHRQGAGAGFVWQSEGTASERISVHRRGL